MYILMIIYIMVVRIIDNVVMILFDIMDLLFNFVMWFSGFLFDNIFVILGVELSGFYFDLIGDFLLMFELMIWILVLRLWEIM